MKITRRSFVNSCATAVAAAAGFIGSGSAAWAQTAASADDYLPPVGSDPLTYLTGEQFRPLVDTVIAGSIEGSAPVAFRLTGVRDLTRVINEKRGYVGEGYALTFEKRGAVRPGTYRFANTLLGSFSLFISPVGSRAGLGEAVVNRISLFK
jgi:hypothetical protein